MTPQVDDVIECLKDGQWHTMTEISQKTRLHELKLVILTEFLAAYTFLHLDKEERKARLSDVFAAFLHETENCEGTNPVMPNDYADIKASKLR